VGEMKVKASIGLAGGAKGVVMMPRSIDRFGYVSNCIERFE
jgi:hypothetical protein